MINKYPIIEIQAIIGNEKFQNCMIKNMKGMFNNGKYIHAVIYNKNNIDKFNSDSDSDFDMDHFQPNHPSDAYINKHHFDIKGVEWNDDVKSINIHTDPVIFTFLPNTKLLHIHLVELLMNPYGPSRYKRIEMYEFEKGFFTKYPQFNIEHKTKRTYKDMTLPFINYTKKKVQLFKRITKYLKVKEYQQMIKELTTNLSANTIERDMHEYIESYFDIEIKKNIKKSNYNDSKQKFDSDSDNDSKRKNKIKKKSDSNSDNDSKRKNKTKKKSDSDSDNDSKRRIKSDSDSGNDSRRKVNSDSDNDSKRKIKNKTKKKSDSDSINDSKRKNKTGKK
jgi:hypothetical protein